LRKRVSERKKEREGQGGGERETDLEGGGGEERECLSE
jgi:hypothetical protein